MNEDRERELREEIDALRREIKRVRYKLTLAVNCLGDVLGKIPFGAFALINSTLEKIRDDEP